MVEANKYYKSRAVGVTSEVGLTTDRDLAEPMCLRNTTSFIPPRYRKSRCTGHYTTVLKTIIRTLEKMIMSVVRSMMDGL